MGVVNDGEFSKNLRSKNFIRTNVYYLYGKDINGIESSEKRLASKLINPSDGCNFHKFTGKGLNLSLLSDSIEMLPVFAECVYITINDLNADDLSESDLKFLIDIIKNIPHSTVVIFYYTGIDIMAGKKSPTPKNKKLLDAVMKSGTVCEFTQKTSSELSKIIMDKISRRGANISRQNAETLALLCLNNTVLIFTEIEKLTAAVNYSGEITAPIINSLVARQLDSNAFMLAKSAMDFNPTKSISLLSDLFEQRLEPVAIWAAISMSFVDIYRARVALNNNVKANTVKEDFGYKGRGFAIDNAFQDVRKIPIEYLRFCMKVIADTDISLKSSKTNSRILLEKAIIIMAAGRVPQ